MKHFLSALCVINIILISGGNGSLMVDRLRWDFLNLEDKLWKYVLEQYKYGFNETDDPGVAMISVFHDFDTKLQKIPQSILYGMEVVRQAPSFLFLYSDLRVINDMYDKFRMFLSTSISNNNSIIKEVDERETKMTHIIDAILHDHKNSMNKTIVNIFQSTFSQNDDGNLIGSLVDTILEPDYACKQFTESGQQVFYNLYNAIVLAELKAYVMIQFSYLAQRLQEKGNYVSESLTARKQFEKTVEDTMKTLGLYMKIMPRRIYKCDPKNHIKGVTYDQLTALLQGHIENEADMNYKGSCTKNCAGYSYTENYGCYDSKSAYCRRRKLCSGKIINCKFVESHMTACISPPSSPRRYEYIEYASGKVLGKKYHCSYNSINSWYRWFVHCSYCLCLCDQEGPLSDRYFNLRPVMANVAQNRVVTGVRIIKHNRIVHLQIQEGQLLPYGYINESTIRWVPVDDYKITDKGVKNGVDFHTMNFEKRSMYLDDLKPHEADHIVTGVRFEFIDNYLKFGINVRRFQFESGSISPDSYYIFGGQNRYKVNTYNPDIPTLSQPSIPNFDEDNYVEFTHTSFDKDAAQSTIPFFDTQPVAAEPALPLQGVGIYYKGKQGYGGFIAPIITTYDFSKHINMEFPKTQPRDEPDDEFPITA